MFVVIPGNNVAVNTDYLTRSVTAVTVTQQPQHFSGMAQMPVQTAVVAVDSSSSYGHYLSGATGGQYGRTPQMAYAEEDPPQDSERDVLSMHSSELDDRSTASGPAGEYYKLVASANDTVVSSKPQTALQLPPLVLPTAARRTMACQIPPGLQPGAAFNVRTPEGGTVTVRS